MNEPRVIFRNRMERSNWVVMGFAFAASAGVMVLQGLGIALALALIAGLIALSFIAFVVVMRTYGKTQIAQLTSDGVVFEAELLNLFGRGRTVRIPIGEVESWRWNSAGTRFSTVVLVHDGIAYRMPISAAPTFDRAAFATLAPAVFEPK